MREENIPAFEDVYTAEEQIDRYIRNGDYPSMLKAASVKARVQGDEELSEALSLLSAQLDFSDDDYDDAAVSKTRTGLAKIIRDRRGRAHMTYHSLMTDETAVALFGGEVTSSESIDYATGTILKGGLFDPAIFGGNGLIGEIGPDGNLTGNARYGNRMGYISLPGKFLVPGLEYEASVLLRIPEEKVKGLVYYALHLVVKSDDETVREGSIITEKELAEAVGRGSHVETMMGAPALEKLLLGLGLPDHPEKMVFSILPVVSPRIRPVFFVRECARYRHTCDLNHLYRGILYRCSRVRKLKAYDAPDIIMRNEMRILQEYIDTLWYGKKNRDGKDDTDGLSDMLRDFRKRGFRAGCRDIVSARRYLLGGYIRPSENGNDVPIADPGFFPETITLVTDDGNGLSEVSYKAVIDTNMDRADDLGYDELRVAEGEASGEEEDGLMSSDDIYDETDKIRIACAHGEPCRVRFDNDNDVYVMVPAA